MVSEEHRSKEIFSLIWLDPDVNNLEENIKAQKQFRSWISHLKTFDDADKCKEFILSEPVNQTITLVINERLGSYAIPRIHSLSQVSSIYIYGVNNEKTERWTKNYPKVRKFPYFIYRKS